MTGTPEWLAEQLVLANLDKRSDVDQALRRLQRRATIIDWFQIGYFVVSFCTILILLFVVFGVSHRADRVVQGNEAIKRVADDFARLVNPQAATDPAERQKLLDQLERDRQALEVATSTTTSTTTTTTVPFAPPTTSGRGTGDSPAPAPAPTTTTTRPAPSPTSPSTTAPAPSTTTTVCTSLIVANVCR